MPPGRIILNGPGKTEATLADAVSLGIKLVNIDSLDEIGRLTAAVTHRRRHELATAHAGKAGVPHQPGNTFATDANALLGKINL